MGEMSRAADGFKQLFQRFQNERDVERQEFYLALVDLALKQYDSCGARLEKIVVTHPNGMFVNDAIELMMINRQAAEKPDLMEKLFEAVVFDWRGLSDSARVAFGNVASSAESSMVDFALYRLATIEMDLGNKLEAVAVAERLIEQFEDSYYLPMALKIKADVLAESENEVESASVLYRRILSEFPNFPFSTQVRKALRSIENDSVKDETNQS